MDLVPVWSQIPKSVIKKSKLFNKMSSDICLQRCGIRFNPPSVVVIYTTKDGGGTKVHRRTMPLRNFTKQSGVARAAEELKSNSRHQAFLEKVPTVQLEKLITMIRDKLNGVSREDIMKKVKTLDTIDPEEDLNKVDETTLKFKKAIMEQTFSKNSKTPADPNFKYDIEIDFDVGPLETCDWDKESDSGF